MCGSAAPVAAGADAPLSEVDPFPCPGPCALRARRSARLGFFVSGLMDCPRGTRGSLADPQEDGFRADPLVAGELRVVDQDAVAGQLRVVHGGIVVEDDD